jgi:hypothetical protein
LHHLRQVSTAEALQFATDRELAFMETSARDAININEAFIQIVDGETLYLSLFLSVS